jgi:hypothetical protein
VTVVEQIESALHDIGYTVAYNPQEKTYGKQIVIVLDQATTDVETQTTYVIAYHITLLYVATDVIDVMKKLRLFMTTIEPNVTALSFAFESPVFDIEGTTYRVGLPCVFKEVINIE